MKNLIVPFSFVLAFLASCASAKIGKYEKNTETNLAINYTINKIYINDQRKNIATEELRLPVFSYPGQKIQYRPYLDEKREIINEVVKKNFTGGGRKIDLTVFIEEGYKAFSGGAVTEKEETLVKITIEGKDQDNNVLASSFTESIKIVSMDAKNKRLERQYEATLKSAVYNSLKNLR